MKTAPVPPSSAPPRQPRRVVACPYLAEHERVWDRLVAQSWNGTFLHTRRFLSYHGERFRDASLILVDEREHPVGVFPAAIDPEDESCVVSHPGLTYGGVIHGSGLRGTALVLALEAIREVSRGAGRHLLRYKAVPWIYHRVPAADDLYALAQLGAVRTRCDLASGLWLADKPRLAKGRKHALAKSRRLGIEVAVGHQHLAPLWGVLEASLAARHRAQPTHSLVEIQRLGAMFPDNIDCVVALHRGDVVAGAVLFRNGPVAHTQYLGASLAGYDMAGTDAVIDRCIAIARNAGARFFDFGTSTDPQRGTLNEGLFLFKSTFGAGAVQYEQFSLDLD